MIPSDKKDRAIYHMILSDMHRLQALMLNLQTLDEPSTEKALHEHFQREQGLVLAKLGEWRQRRPQLYQQATQDFRGQVTRE